ncbi:MAG: hypothetical protein OXH50_08915, partial [Gemmatimonadetes bacterium]|nr:hypothetical protein [Gemmatimonadota bacterium]
MHVADREVGVAVVVDVPDGDSHAGLRLAVGVDGAAGHHAALLEALPAVEPQPVHGLVVGDEDVLQAVAVEVGAGDAEAVAGHRLETGRGADVGEGAAVVAVEPVGSRRRVALGAAELRQAEGVDAVDLRVGAPAQVVDQHEVEVPVTVVVEEGGRSPPARVPDAGPFGGVLEAAAAEVPQQSVLPEVGDVEVDVAVVVDVAGGHPHAVSRGLRPGSRGRFEVTAAPVAVEPVRGLLRGGGGEAAALNEVGVEVA